MDKMKVLKESNLLNRDQLVPDETLNIQMKYSKEAIIFDITEEQIGPTAFRFLYNFQLLNSLKIYSSIEML